MFNALTHRSWCGASLALLATVTIAAVCTTLSAPTLAAQDAAATQTSRRARVAGVVTDVNTKQPLAGVNVFLVGTPITASTGADGRFVIPSAPVGLYNIDVRRLGYGQQRVTNVRLIADSLTTVNVALSVTSTRLDQVTVSGSMDAQSVAKSTITVDKITTENIPVMPTGSAAGLISGKVAGVAITRPSGKPGSGVNIV